MLGRIEGDRVALLRPLTDEQFGVIAANERGFMLRRTPETPNVMALWKTDTVAAKPLCQWPAVPGGRSSPNKKSNFFPITPDGRTLVTTDDAPGTPPIIRIWHRSDDAAPPVEAASFSTSTLQHSNSIFALALSPDGQRIAVAAVNGLSLWSLQNDKPMQLWYQQSEWYSVAFSPDGRQVAASHNDHGTNDFVALFNDAGECQTQWEFPSAPSDLAFAPDGRHLLTANTNGTVYILHLKDAAKPSDPPK